MDDVMRTRFDVSWFDMQGMIEKSRRIAQDFGIMKDPEIDSFRHAYVAAKARKDFGENLARAGGYGVEVVGFMGGSQLSASQSDLVNNEIGFDIGRKADEYIMAERQKRPDILPDEEEELWDRYVRTTVAMGVKNGELIPNPSSDPHDIWRAEEKYGKLARPVINPAESPFGLFPEPYSGHLNLNTMIKRR